MRHRTPGPSSRDLEKGGAGEDGEEGKCRLSNGNNPPLRPMAGRWGRGEDARGQRRREGAEKRWREVVETLEGKEPSARNSPEKPKRRTEDRDKVSLLPGSRSKRCPVSGKAVLGRKTAFFTARSGAAGRRGQRMDAQWPEPECAAAQHLSLCCRGTPTGNQVTPKMCPAAVAPCPDAYRVPLLFWAVFKSFVTPPFLSHRCFLN